MSTIRECVVSGERLLECSDAATAILVTDRLTNDGEHMAYSEQLSPGSLAFDGRAEHYITNNIRSIKIYPPTKAFVGPADFKSGNIVGVSVRIYFDTIWSARGNKHLADVMLSTTGYRSERRILKYALSHRLIELDWRVPIVDDYPRFDIKFGGNKVFYFPALSIKWRAPE